MSLDKNIIWQRKKVLEKVSENLKKNNFKAYIAETLGDIETKLIELSVGSKTVGFGGSMSLIEIKASEILASKSREILAPNPSMSISDSIEMRRRALTSDVYLASPNALSVDGKLFFCDGVGNRVSALIFGPKKVIVVCGYNKIVEDSGGAWRRLRNTASPVNAKRLNCDTPCTKDGFCHNCSSSSRICNVNVEFLKKPKYSDFHVILYTGDLGY